MFKLVLEVESVFIEYVAGGAEGQPTGFIPAADSNQMQMLK